MPVLVGHNGGGTRNIPSRLPCDNVVVRYDCRLLLESGAGPDAREVRGFTALHLASKWGASDCAAALVEFGADPDAAGMEEYDKTPLHRAR